MALADLVKPAGDVEPQAPSLDTPAGSDKASDGCVCPSCGAKLKIEAEPSMPSMTQQPPAPQMDAGQPAGDEAGMGKAALAGML